MADACPRHGVTASSERPGDLGLVGSLKAGSWMPELLRWFGAFMLLGEGIGLILGVGGAVLDRF